MASAVFFKFKSQKEPQRVTFDGTGISVFELKRDIIAVSRLGDGSDFDLAIYNPDSNEEYDDDTTIVSRGTTVVARRLPAAKPGAGRAARYVSGKMPVTAKNQHRIEATKMTATVKDSKSPSVNLASNATEEDRIAAMFNQGGEQWEQQQAQMANQKAIHRTGYVKPHQAVPDKPLPAGYTCHRCGEKGHWIQACPTNSDPTFDNRPKFKKTTGIPRSFLKVVDKPPALSSDGSVDVSQLPAGVMYTANGEWVVAEPDKASWDQFQAKAKAQAERAEAATNNQDIQEWGLECPIDQRMFVDPVKTPCCGKTYCRECIENALLSSDFICPGCQTEGVLVDNLIEDDDAIKKMKDFAESLAKDKETRATSASPAPEAENTVSTPQKSTSVAPEKPTPGKESTSKSPSVKPASPTTETVTKSETPKSPANSTGSKKRAAEDELENKRIPTGPAAMRNRQAQQQQGNSNNMNDFVQQMNAMASNMGQNPQAMNSFMNPMGFPGMMNPMMGMPNPMMMMNNPMGFPGMGFPQGNMMNNGGFNNGNMGFNQQWQGNGQNWGNGMGRGQNQYNQQQGMQQQQNQQGNDAYMRKPVNPNRFQNRNRNQQQRSVDYREL
ncbi:DWNN-domain-containing protein [Myriangium duriaei CBS 260.36]|uniref:DWNN-domain-containing protein n=1 Tax=Myriangium duriaei CBS 260.36 TaxID=1168546 RepID=A0A9P4J9U2_9PEZI|nr:DWNN-domain-containing protein [Myriangium duriaei CBS 260.36]